jgi:hypothetical protein
MFMEERISRWLAKVPGYTGYRSKEDRRDEDKRIRVAIANDLDAIVDQLTRIGADLATRRELGKISAIEGVLADTRHLADRIRTASYGYGGIFTERSIDEHALEQLRQFDIALQREVIGLGPLANKVGDDKGMQAFRDDLIALTTLFNSRSEVVDTGKATRDEQTLALLNRPPKATPSPLLGVSVGDALSVLGDNFTVDATIALKYGNAEIKLVRIAGETNTGERWLLGSSATEIWPSADLTEVTAGAGTSSLVAASGTGPTPASMTVEGPQGSDSEIPVSYDYAQADDSTISLEISVGGEVRSFTGKVLKDIDVEIYGSTGARS